MVLEALQDRGWRLRTYELGTDGALAKVLEDRNDAFRGGDCLDPSASEGDLLSHVRQKIEYDDGTDVGLSLIHEYSEKKAILHIAVLPPSGEEEFVRSYGGPPADAPIWGVSQALEALRRQLS